MVFNIIFGITAGIFVYQLRHRQASGKHFKK